MVSGIHGSAVFVAASQRLNHYTTKEQTDNRIPFGFDFMRAGVSSLGYGVYLHIMNKGSDEDDIVLFGAGCNRRLFFICGVVKTWHDGVMPSVFLPADAKDSFAFFM